MLWCPGIGDTVRMFRNNGANHRATGPLLRSEKSAGSTLHAISSPKMYTTIWRFCVLSHACAHQNLECRHVRSSLPTTIHDDDGGTNGRRLAVVLVGTLSAGDSPDTIVSSRTESSGRPCSTMETLEEANAIGSLS